MRKANLTAIGGAVLTAVAVWAAEAVIEGFDPATRIYVVRPGDTLWDLADTFFDDNWKWPRIWENNPQVHNPHLIYPEDRLRIPLLTEAAPTTAVAAAPTPAPEPLPTTAPAAPAPKPQAVPEPVPQVTPPASEPETADTASSAAEVLAKDDELIEASRLTIEERTQTGTELPPGIYLLLGNEGIVDGFAEETEIRIVGGHDGRELFAEGDVVYLSRGRDAGLQPGVRYYVYEDLGPVVHPRTDEELGRWVRIVGGLEVVRVTAESAEARVTFSDDAIEKRMLLTQWRERPTSIVAHPAAAARKGEVIHMPNIVMAGTYQIVYVDLGERDGVRPGELVAFWRDEGVGHDPVRDVEVKLPERLAAIGVIVETSRKTATVLIVESKGIEVRLGDRVRTLVEQG